MRAACGVGADQDPAAQVPGQLGQRQPGCLDVVSDGVGAGAAGPQHDREGFPVPCCAVVGEGGQRVEPERLLLL